MKDKHIKNIYSPSDIVILAALIISGLIFTLAVPSLVWLGVSLLTTGLCLLPFLRTGYVIESQKGIFKRKEFVLPHECRDQIAEYIEGSSDTLNIDPYNKGGMLLEFYFRKGCAQQFGRICDYEGYRYSPQCKLSELSEERLNTLLKYRI